MLNSFRYRRLVSLVTSGSRRRSKIELRLELLETRSLMAMPVDLGPLAGVSASVSGIDMNNDVIETQMPDPANGLSSAYFLKNNGSPTDIPIITGYTSNFATALNDSDRVVGYSELPGAAFGAVHEAYLYTPGAANPLTPLGFLGGSSPDSEAEAINVDGDIVGYSTTLTGSDHAFLYSSSGAPTMQDLAQTETAAAEQRASTTRALSSAS